MTNEEILEQARAMHLISTNIFIRVDAAMDLVRGYEAVAFETWQIEKKVYRIQDSYSSVDGSISADTPEQLYQLFKKDTNGK